MQNSGISSQAGTSTSPSPSGPSRRRFSLTGRSATIDPRVDAARPDLADVRLADRIFAPHYAAAMPRTLAKRAELRVATALDSEVLVTLVAGDAFEVLEIVGDCAWGIAAAIGLVGYVPTSALEPLLP